ncbi:hypothetical protein [Thermophilibacter provencensis]|uniref:hypothetical protein n=1 Tax=Thermophilibacter provencensis TaxID=1852386 RepID=UPI003AA92634
MAVLNVTRDYEDVYLQDPEEHPEAPRYRVRFDDASIDAMLAKIGDALDRARGLERRAAEASTDEERAEVARVTAHLQRRVIVAVIGPEGYDDVLRLVGDGEPADPETHVVQLGEVFAQLMDLVSRRASSEKLREYSLHAYREGERARKVADMRGRQGMRAVAGGKKGRRK